MIPEPRASSDEVRHCHFSACDRVLPQVGPWSTGLYCGLVCEIADAQINTLRAEVLRLRLQLNGTVR